MDIIGSEWSPPARVTEFASVNWFMDTGLLTVVGRNSLPRGVGITSNDEHSGFIDRTETRGDSLRLLASIFVYGSDESAEKGEMARGVVMIGKVRGVVRGVVSGAVSGDGRGEVKGEVKGEVRGV